MGFFEWCIIEVCCWFVWLQLGATNMVHDWGCCYWRFLDFRKLSSDKVREKLKKSSFSRDASLLCSYDDVNKQNGQQHCFLYVVVFLRSLDKCECDTISRLFFNTTDDEDIICFIIVVVVVIGNNTTPATAAATWSIVIVIFR